MEALVVIHTTHLASSNAIRWDVTFDPSIHMGNAPTAALFTQAVSAVINALATAMVSGQQQQQDSKVMTMLREMMDTVSSQIRGTETVVVSTVQAQGQDVRDSLTSQIKGVEGAVVNAVHAQAQDVKDEIKGAESALVDAVRSNGQELCSQVKGTESALVDAVRSNGQELCSQVKGAESALVDAVRSNGQELCSQVKGAESALVDAVRSNGQELCSQVKGTESALVDAVRSNGQELCSQVKGTEAVLIAALHSHGQEVSKSVAGVMTGIQHDMLHLITSVTASVQASIKQLDTTQFVSSVSDHLRTWVPSKDDHSATSKMIQDTVASPITRMLGGLKHEIERLPQGINGVQTSVTELVNGTRRQLSVFERQHEDICSRCAGLDQRCGCEQRKDAGRTAWVVQGSAVDAGGGAWSPGVAGEGCEPRGGHH
jgi:pyrimidine operon attenuation protein/uracil phosphoribosyltransferase